MKATIDKICAAQLSSTAKKKGLSVLLIAVLVLSISGVFTLGEAFLAQGSTSNEQPVAATTPLAGDVVAVDDILCEAGGSNDSYADADIDSAANDSYADASADTDANDSYADTNDNYADVDAGANDAASSASGEDEADENPAAVSLLGSITPRGPPTGYPMYSWGNNSAGHLGLGDTVVRTTPQRVEGGAKWVYAVTALHGSFAICVDGYLYGWGGARGAYNMGQGGVVSHLPATLTTPTRIGTANNWVSVSARSSSVAAIRADGSLWAWGINDQGQVGDGTTNNRNTPTRVGTRTDWASVTVGGGAGNNMMLGVTTSGQLYTWGGNSFGLLGRGSPNAAGRRSPAQVPGMNNVRQVSASTRTIALVTNAGHLYTWGNNWRGQFGNGTTSTSTNSMNTPTRRGTATNWREVRTTDYAVAALRTDNTLWTWGNNNGQGQLGRGDLSGTNGTITQLGSRTDWLSVHGGNSHFLAFSSAGRLYSWGNNSSGQLGVGGTTHRESPTLITETLGFTTAARGGGTHSIMLMHIEPVEPDEFLAEKILKMPAGTSDFNLDFTFNMNRRSFNDLDTPAALANFPSYGNERVVPMSDSSSVVSDPADPILRLSGIVDLLEGVTGFAEPGIYAWTISECDDPVAAGVGPNSQASFSLEQFKLIVDVRQEPGVGGELYIGDMRSYRIVDEEGNDVVPPELSPIVFENIYKRTTTGTPACPGALSVSKTVEGPPADPTTVFTFNITLIATALCVAPEGTTFTGRVYEGSTFVRYEGPFTSGTARPVPLLDGQKIVFPALVVGTQFDVEEQAMSDFIAEVLLYVNGEYTVLYNTDVNLPLSVEGPHLIKDASRNSADFTNEHDFIAIPMGLSLSNNSWLVVVIAAGLLFVLLSLSKLKRREREQRSLPPLNLWT